MQGLATNGSPTCFFAVVNRWIVQHICSGLYPALRVMFQLPVGPSPSLVHVCVKQLI